MTSLVPNNEHLHYTESVLTLRHDPSLGSEGRVEVEELLQEALVGENVPVLPKSPQGLHRRHALPLHEEGRGDGGGPRDAHETVDQNFACGRIK